MGIGKTLKAPLARFFLRQVRREWLEAEFARRQIDDIRRALGAFADGGAEGHRIVRGLDSESGVIRGDLVAALAAVARPEHSLLLPGERRNAREAYSRLTGIPVARILTAGLHEDMDFRWNYEEAPPAGLAPVDLVASHAMLEHLIDPARHLRDCYGLLKPGGHLVLHTVLPGFMYHRYPVDCLRFFPDWFEEMAARLGAAVARRSLDAEGHVVYALRRPQA